MHRARMYYHKVQFSINRIAELYYYIKVKKVAASMVLNNQELYDKLQATMCSANAINVIRAVVAIQRRWRVKFQSRFNAYRKI